MAKQDVKLFSAKEAAEYLGVSTKTLSRWRDQTDSEGRPKGPDFIDLNGMIRYRVSDLEDYIDGRKRQPGDNFAA